MAAAAAASVSKIRAQVASRSTLQYPSQDSRGSCHGDEALPVEFAQWYPQRGALPEKLGSDGCRRYSRGLEHLQPLQIFDKHPNP